MQQHHHHHAHHQQQHHPQPTFGVQQHLHHHPHHGAPSPSNGAPSPNPLAAASAPVTDVGEAVGRCLKLLNEAMRLWLHALLAHHKGPQYTEWVQEALGMRRPAPMNELDTRAILSLLLGQWDAFFRDHMQRHQRSLLFDVRSVRNAWAHQEPFNSREAFRATDVMYQLMLSLGPSVSAYAQAVDQVCQNLILIMASQVMEVRGGVVAGGGGGGGGCGVGAGGAGGGGGGGGVAAVAGLHHNPMGVLGPSMSVAPAHVAPPGNGGALPAAAPRHGRLHQDHPHVPRAPPERAHAPTDWTMSDATFT